jgi:hypothetical protein
MEFESEINQYYLNSIVDYDPITGIFIWKYNDKMPKQWNDKFANKEAGYIGKFNGDRYYRMMWVSYRKYLAHTLAFFIVHGEWIRPIDHKDGNGLNNAISNLVKTNYTNNTINRKLGKCKSGFIGVSQYPAGGKWKAYITVNKKSLYLGSFTLKEDAINARKQAEIKYGFDKIIFAR